MVYISVSVTHNYLRYTLKITVLWVCTSYNLSTKVWKDSAKSKAASESFSIDSAKLRNNAPKIITNALTLSGAKHEIKKFYKTLEI